MGRELLGMQTLPQQLKRASRGPAARVLASLAAQTLLSFSLALSRICSRMQIARRVKDLARSARVSFALRMQRGVEGGGWFLLFILAPRRMQIRASVRAHTSVIRAEN